MKTENVETREKSLEENVSAIIDQSFMRGYKTSNYHMLVIIKMAMSKEWLNPGELFAHLIDEVNKSYK